MRRIGLALLVMAVSPAWTHSANAAVRPRYGGTLRVAIQAAPLSIDPNDSVQANSVSLPSVSRLIFETLVVIDEHGEPQPWLASSWQAEPGNQRWQFSIPRGVTFSDGSPLTPDTVAASLRSANPKWKIFPAADAVMIECEVADPFLPAELAQTRYGIAKRDQPLRGTGPFAIKEWSPGKKLILIARDDYWSGRAFVDSVEIELGKAARDQMIALDVGKLDLSEVSPETASVANDRRIERSLPVQWVGLVFAPAEARLREALGLSIDRATINNVLLRGSGEVTGSFLPEWMSGYSFLFPVSRNLDRARQLTSETRASGAWSLSFDSSDPLLRLIAERIVLNAKDAGLSLQLSNASSADITLVRLMPASTEPHIALGNLLARLGFPAPTFENASPSALYAAEKAALESQRVLPLFHLRSTVALGAALRDLQQTDSGVWRLDNVWLWAGTP